MKLSNACRQHTAGISTKGSVVTSCQATCTQLLVILSKIHANAAGQALLGMLEACLNPDASNPAEGLVEQIVESLCQVAASYGNCKEKFRCALRQGAGNWSY